MNRVTTITNSPAAGVLLTQSQDYDSRGRLTYRQDARGNQVSFGYDVGGED